MCFSQPQRTNYIYSYCMMFYTITKKKCSPFSWYKTRFVWFSRFTMTVVQNQATLSKNAGLGQAHPQKQQAVNVLTRYVQYWNISHWGIMHCYTHTRARTHARTHERTHTHTHTRLVMVTDRADSNWSNESGRIWIKSNNVIKNKKVEIHLEK